MSETTTSTYRANVAKHRDQLTHRHAAGDLRYGHWDDNRRTNLKHNATAAQRFVVEWSVAGWVSVLLLAAAVVGGSLLSMPFPGLETVGMAGGFVVGGTAAYLVCWARNSWIAPVQLEMSSAGDALFEMIEESVAEITEAADRGVPGAADLLTAATSMRPGIEELLEETGNLSLAYRRNHGYARGDYRTALAEKQTAVETALVDITAELLAAAEIVFARRDDLLVAHPLRDLPLELPATALTGHGQQTLTESRELLARIADDIA